MSAIVKGMGLTYLDHTCRKQERQGATASRVMKPISHIFVTGSQITFLLQYPIDIGAFYLFIYLPHPSPRGSLPACNLPAPK